jgi:hypothetical protein
MRTIERVKNLGKYFCGLKELLEIGGKEEHRIEKSAI